VLQRCDFSEEVYSFFMGLVSYLPFIFKFIIITQVSQERGIASSCRVMAHANSLSAACFAAQVYHAPNLKKSSSHPRHIQVLCSSHKNTHCIHFA
jgi:hypothetical protein